MSKNKETMTIRSPTFSQYFATTTGISYTARNVRIDYGNEITMIAPGQNANVSECQIIMDYYSFKSTYQLFGRILKEIEDNFGKIDMKKEKEMGEKLKAIRESKVKALPKP